MRPTGVLFICMGNICRSPLAEGVFTHLARERGVLERFLIDSCGTGGWHAGSPPDRRSVDVARRHGIELFGSARQIDPEVDFERFEHLLVMDRDNLENVLAVGGPRDRVRLLRSYDPELSGHPAHALEVPDPYYGPGDGFQHVFDIVHRACGGLLTELMSAR